MGRLKCWLVIAWITVFAVLPLVCEGRSSAASTDNFTITSFVADYYLSRDSKQVSTMTVEEEIVALFPNFDQNHGIFRAIPTEYKELPLQPDVDSVTDANGKKISYSTDTSNGNLVLKIGDADTYVRGPTTYRIKYTLRNVISFYPDHDELYWDVNGDQWSQPFGAVTARLHVPTAIAGNLKMEQKCFAGTYGSTTSDCTITQTKGDDGTLVTVQAQELSPASTLTFVSSFDVNTFKPDEEYAKRQAMLAFIAAGIFIGLPILTLVVMARRWAKYGKDSKGRGVIVPEYIPLKELSVLKSDALMNDTFRNKAISAQIIDLAIRKYIALYEFEKKGLLGGKSQEYDLELLRETTDLKTEEREVIELFFNGENAAVGSRVSIKDYKTKLFTKVTQLSASVTNALLDEGYYRNHPTKVKQQYMGAGAGLMVASFLLIFVMDALKSIMPIVAGLIFAGFICGVIVMIFGRYMPARSEQGVEALDYLRGLHEYIELAEADQIRYLQSPEGVKQYGSPGDPQAKVKLFEKLLPYAIIFGLEKEWAKQFKDIYQQPPDWYHGNNMAAFNAAYLASSLGGFTSASAGSFAAPSSSGSSGFGGGGSSGGGGGGGGGGGW